MSKMKEKYLDKLNKKQDFIREDNSIIETRIENEHYWCVPGEIDILQGPYSTARECISEATSYKDKTLAECSSIEIHSIQKTTTRRIPKVEIIRI